jgi:uncharacterized protein YndB with AHSA1/START domain
VTTTAVERVIRAPRSTVYRTLLDPNLVQAWRVPDGMTGTIHRFEPFEGGRIRLTLTYYEDPARHGKSGAHHDTYCGRFTKLVPDELIIEVDEFESADPALSGETISLFELPIMNLARN